jgi:hypothetical protein
MKKHKSASQPFTSTSVHATTASAGFVKTVTDSVRLLEKTALVILVEENGTKHMSVYRESTALPGSYSRDIYKRRSKRWQLVGKDEDKYQGPPWAPAGATKTVIDGITVWTMQPLTDIQRNELRELIATSNAVESARS